MKTLLEILKASSDYLGSKGIESPRREAELLLADFLNVNRLDLYLDTDRPLEENELHSFRARLKRRGAGEPGQYIHGKVDFYGLKMQLTPAVLIPRQETEILVDQIVKDLKRVDLQNKKLLDLCSGSGCMGLALKKACPELDVSLSDLSEEALKIAKKNADQNGLQVTFFHGDFLKPLAGLKFDYIVCNPPYISDQEYLVLGKEVRDFEPKTALLADDEGLEFYVRFQKEARGYLNPKGKVWFEIGYLQGKAIAAIFQDPIWKHFDLKKDWAGHDRFISLEIE